jgi:hypothetical protein
MLSSSSRPSLGVQPDARRRGRLKAANAVRGFRTRNRMVAQLRAFVRE